LANQQIKIEVEGMTCGGCASKVTSALQRDRRISSAVVDFATRTGVVEGELSRGDVGAIIASVGYKLVDNEVAASTSTKSSLERLSPEARGLLPAASLALPVVVLAMAPWHVHQSEQWQFGLTTLFLVWPAAPFFIRTMKQVKHGYVTMDTLVSIGMASAWLASIVMMQMGDPHLYFESSVMVGFFVMLGKALEDQARRKSIGDVDRLVKLRPRTVWRSTPGKAPEEIPLAEAKIGELIYLRPGDMLALDAIVVEGHVSFDESVITGESVPVVRQRGEKVPSGAVNASSSGVTLQITRIGNDTTVEQIIRLIEDARLSRPPIQKFADKISSVFVPIVMILALLTGVGWWFIGQSDFNTALMRGLSVLVVACPCALGLATPVAWVAGLGRAARAGVLVRSYEALETLRKAQAIVFDKTGTLTYGRPTVIRVNECEGISKKDVMPATMSALSHSSHPLSRAVAGWIKENYNVAEAPLSKLQEETAGQGVRCEILTPQREIVRIGKPDFVVKGAVPSWSEAEASGHMLVAVSINEKPTLLFELEDTLRSDVKDALARIAARHMDIYIASGDRPHVVEKMAADLQSTSFNITSVQGAMTPLSKRDLVLSLQKAGKTVAFVGDGINDAPALAAADVGISLGTGTDVAAHSAGLVLQKAGISTLVEAIDLSSRITKVIRENFFWAFFYNIAAIPVAMAGFVTPMWASAAMALSSLSVVTNALRLRR
jgi:P-type Cu+ transporter